jgi:hypothetical protein
VHAVTHVQEAGRAEISATERRTMVTVLLVAALLIVAYWTAWLVHRSLVASETGMGYVQFEDAFPLADAWLVVCLLGGAWTLARATRTALFWLNGIVELCINLLTLGLSLFVLRWAWVRREVLLHPDR